ncbi:MAG: DUF3822 family protein [Crocinitomicaceae bacterium]|nr:DUF3822 family protein [Crocinitomicaceae bacterium]
MSVFNPEAAARALFPHELAGRSTGLHFALHLSPKEVQVSAAETGGEVVWCDRFEIENRHSEKWAGVIRFIEERNWGKYVFRKTTVSFDTPHFTLVPAGFVQQGKEAELLYFQQPRLTGTIETEQFSDTGIALIYELPSEIKSMAGIFPGARFFPVASPLLRYCSPPRDKNNHSFFLYAQSGLLVLIAHRKGVFQLCNPFDVQGNEDILYHLANASIRLGMDLSEAVIILSGNLVSEDLEKLIGTYSRHVSIWEGPAAFSWKKEEVAAQFFPSLLHLLCV